MPPPTGGDVARVGGHPPTMRISQATHEATIRATVTTNGPEVYCELLDGFMDGLAAVAEALGIAFRPGVGNAIGHTLGGLTS